MKGTISLCKFEDLIELQKISIETFNDTFAEQNDLNNLKEYLIEAYHLEKLKKEMMNSNSRFFFICLDNRIAGYLKVNVDSAQTEKIDKNGLEVERIYIRKEYKRHGLGRQLLEFAIELANKERRKLIWLGVWEENENALRFYQTFGFRQIGTHDFYVGMDKQTDLIMAKELGRTVKNNVSV